MDILLNNPFINLTEIFNPIAMQLFIVAMVALVIIGTVVDIIHIFLIMPKKQNSQLPKN
jgi:hypothetical protein